MAVHNSLDKAISEATELLHLAPNQTKVSLRSLSNILIKVYKIDDLFSVNLYLNNTFVLSKDYINLKRAMKYINGLFENVSKERHLSLDEIDVYIEDIF